MGLTDAAWVKKGIYWSWENAASSKALWAPNYCKQDISLRV